MRGYTSLLPWLSWMEGKIRRRLLAHRGSGISLSLCLLGLIVWGIDWAFPAIASWGPLAPIMAAFLPTLAQCFAAFAVALCGSVGVLAFVAWSQTIRRFIHATTTLLLDIPALGWVGLALGAVPPVRGCIFIAAFGLCVRIVHAVLESERKIPSPLLKSAYALRLGPWQRFWRLHMPVAFPRLVRGIVQDMPDFWVRLIGAQAVFSLILGTPIAGAGGQLVAASQGHHMLLFSDTLLATLALIFLWQHAWITPMLRRSRRYETQFIMSSRETRYEDYARHAWWQNPWHYTAFMALLLSVLPIIFRISPWCDITWAVWQTLSVLLPVFMLSLLLWVGIGGVMMGASPKRRRGMRLFCSLCVLSPLFLFYPYSASPILTIALMTLSLQGTLGWSILFRAEDPTRDHLFQTALRLRLPPYRAWLTVRLPLLMPPLWRGAPVLVSLLWNQIYFAAIMAPITPHHGLSTGEILRSVLHTMPLSTRVFLIVIMSMLAFGLHHAVITPLHLRFARKYRVSP